MFAASQRLRDVDRRARNEEPRRTKGIRHIPECSSAGDKEVMVWFLVGGCWSVCAWTGNVSLERAGTSAKVLALAMCD